jgi:hypothetical protein
MPQKDMPKEVSIMGGCPMFGMSQHLVNLAALEAERKAKAPRLRAQQRGRVAKGKKGRFGAALRHLWGSWGEICRPRLRPHNPSKADSATLARPGERKGQPCGPLPQMSPAQKAR